MYDIICNKCIAMEYVKLLIIEQYTVHDNIINGKCFEHDY